MPPKRKVPQITTPSPRGRNEPLTKRAKRETRGETQEGMEIIQEMTEKIKETEVQEEENEIQEEKEIQEENEIKGETEMKEETEMEEETEIQEETEMEEETATEGQMVVTAQMEEEPSQSATSSFSEFKRYLHIESVNQNLLCSVCTEPLQDAMETSCHHLFCKECIFQWLERNTNCPVCRENITTSNVQGSAVINRMVGELQVQCYHCDWTGALANETDHLKSCDFLAIDCPFAKYGCTVQQMRKYIDKHMKDTTDGHLELVLDFHSTFEQQKEGEIQELEKKIEEYKNTVHCLQMELERSKKTEEIYSPRSRSRSRSRGINRSRSRSRSRSRKIARSRSRSRSRSRRWLNRSRSRSPKIARSRSRSRSRSGSWRRSRSRSPNGRPFNPYRRRNYRRRRIPAYRSWRQDF